MSKYLYYFLILATGILLGVVFSNWTYFKLDKNVSISDLVTLLLSSGIAIYIGSTIQSAIYKKQTAHEIYFDEIKKIIAGNEIFETWLDNKKLPFEESKKYFKKGSVALLFCQSIFSSRGISQPGVFAEIINNFNNLKQEILNISPIDSYIELNDAQMVMFDEKYRNIKEALFGLLLQ